MVDGCAASMQDREAELEPCGPFAVLQGVVAHRRVHPRERYPAAVCEMWVLTGADLARVAADQVASHLGANVHGCGSAGEAV